MGRRKRSRRKLVVKMKKGESSSSSRSNSNWNDDRDRFNELPLSLLLHLMGFMNTKDAVQSSVLSKQWRDLWKYLTAYSFDSSHFRRVSDFCNFVSRVLTNRDHSISLLNLDIVIRCVSELKLLNSVMKYAKLHNVQYFRIDIILYSQPDFKFRNLIFSSPALKFLRLSVSPRGPVMKLPNSLHLPALETLHLKNLCFTATDNDSAEPFSNCDLLNTLVLDSCYLDDGAKVLCIYNSNLCSLNLDFSFAQDAYRIVLSTPNLSSLNAAHFSCHQLSSTCNLSFLEKVNLDSGCSGFTCSSGIVSWLHVFSNVKKMTISSRTLEFVQQRFLQDPDSVGAQPQHPFFVRLESVIVVMNSWTNISDGEVNRMLKSLLHNSPPNRVVVIKH